MASRHSASRSVWKDLAECIKWQQEQADVLPDAHWVGGNPWDGKKANVYGWAAWNGIQDWETVKQGSMLLTTWIKKYCEGGVGIKKSTLHCRVEMLHTVEKYLDETNKGFISLEEVNAEFCRGYVKFLRNFPNSHIKYGEPRPISENTASRYLGMFSTALNNAVRQGIIRNNPMKELDARERIQPKEGKKEYLTIEELRTLIATDICL